MATVGQRPQQFNPIQRTMDNTDVLEAEAARVAAKLRRRPIPDFTGQTLPDAPKVVPPMSSRKRRAGGNGSKGNGDGNGNGNGNGD